MSQECNCYAGERVEAVNQHGAKFCRACGHWIMKPAKPRLSDKRRQAIELTNLIMRTGKVVRRDP